MKTNRIINQVRSFTFGLISLVPAFTFYTASAQKIGREVYRRLAICHDRTFWAWGKNDKGRVGIGTTNSQLIPISSQVPDKVISVKGGQYGGGTDSNINKIPYQAGHYIRVNAIEAGKGSSFALMPYGTFWASGFNAYDNRGNGTNIFSNMPVQVMGLSDLIAISQKALRHGLEKGWHNMGLEL